MTADDSRRSPEKMVRPCHAPTREFGGGIPEGEEFVVCYGCGALIRPLKGAKWVSIDEALRKMEKLAEDDDYEDAHYDADRILCEVLEELGQKELVRAWEKVGKWYA